MFGKIIHKYDANFSQISILSTVLRSTIATMPPIDKMGGNVLKISAASPIYIERMKEQPMILPW